MLNSTCALAVALALQTAAPAPETPPDDTADRPFQQFFQNLGRDIVALPSPESAIVMASGIGSALVVHSSDDDVSTWTRSQGTADYARIGDRLGSGWVQGGVALTTYGVGVLTGQRTMTHLGSDLIRAQALNAVLTRGLKFASGRRRPSGGPESLPSGHTSASFASAAVLDAHFGWRVGIPAYAVAGFVGWTRVRDNAHWLTDVIVGSAIGVSVGRTVARGHRDGERTWTIVPSAGSSHVAVYVTRIGP